MPIAFRWNDDALPGPRCAATWYPSLVKERVPGRELRTLSSWSTMAVLKGWVGQTRRGENKTGRPEVLRAAVEASSEAILITLAEMDEPGPRIE